MSRFEELLTELGEMLETPLKPSQGGACLLHINEQLFVQIELDSARQRILLFCKVVDIPPGKFRENVLRDALKANHMAASHSSTLGYIQSSNHLALFQYIEMHNLTAKILYAHLTLFVTRSLSWKEAINNGKPSPVNKGEFPEGLKRAPSIFGIP